MKAGPKKRPEMERFMEKVNKTDTCWLWTAGTTLGYATFGPTERARTVRGHRWIYEQLVGPIPAGMELDHTCKIKSCVNPDHLRVTTRKQNSENRGARAGSLSGFRGVTRGKDGIGWVARVHHDGKRYHVGTFRTVEEAAEAARLKRLDLHTHNDADRMVE